MSARKITVLVLMVAAAVCLAMIVPTRLWVKNKRAFMVYGGRESRELRLFHGGSGRMLMLIREGREETVYVFDPASGIERCEAKGLIVPKFVAMGAPRGCQRLGPGKLENNSLEFKSAFGAEVKIRWLEQRH